MAISTGGGDDTPMSDINTTPLVDVMLVLLIIFLIAVPVAIQTIEKLKIPVFESLESKDKVENLLLTVSTTDAPPAATSSSCRTVRGNQGCRIEFEMAVRLGMNVANRLDRLDQPRPLPQQQTTGLCRISLCRFCQECGFRATCHRRFHRHLL